MIYNIIKPISPKVPILISVPHCGINIPESCKNRYTPEALAGLDDTDWFVDKLYDFATEMGITMVSAKYHRWLIDLNRNSESSPLYTDGRIITGLTPTSDFNGNSIYNTNQEPNQAEIDERLSQYYHPYYDGITKEINELQKTFNHVLFFDAHSIRQYVPGVHAERFPDLVLGDVDETSANQKIIKVAEDILFNSGYTFSHNTPFKGGNLTRNFGKPSANIHALQLEMSKLVYMNDAEIAYDKPRADEVRVILKQLFEGLISCLNKMNSNA